MKNQCKCELLLTINRKPLEKFLTLHLHYSPRQNLCGFHLRVGRTRYWYKELAPLFQPIRTKSKSNRDSLIHFPALSFFQTFSYLGHSPKNSERKKSARSAVRESERTCSFVFSPSPRFSIPYFPFFALRPTNWTHGRGCPALHVRYMWLLRVLCSSLYCPCPLWLAREITVLKP